MTIKELVSSVLRVDKMRSEMFDDCTSPAEREQMYVVKRSLEEAISEEAEKIVSGGICCKNCKYGFGDSYSITSNACKTCMLKGVNQRNEIQFETR